MTTTFIVLAVLITLGILYLCFVPSGNSPITGLWEKLPTHAEYLKANTSAVNSEGQIQCFRCHSTETLDVGLARFTDFRRTVICSRCKTQLWREQD